MAAEKKYPRVIQSLDVELPEGFEEVTEDAPFPDYGEVTAAALPLYATQRDYLELGIAALCHTGLDEVRIERVLKALPVHMQRDLEQLEWFQARRESKT
jgi:hypothetical protein